MHFLPDMYVPCDICHGKRALQPSTVATKGKTIYEVLEMTVEQASTSSRGAHRGPQKLEP